MRNLLKSLLLLTSANLKCFVFAVPNFNYIDTLYKCMYTNSTVYAVYIYIAF